jgi:hypothetical protein
MLHHTTMVSTVDTAAAPMHKNLAAGCGHTIIKSETIKGTRMAARPITDIIAIKTTPS